MNTAIDQILQENSGETLSPKHYSLIPTVKEQCSRFSLVYGDGMMQLEQYSDLHGCLFAATGKSILLHITYNPPIICTGENLLTLEPHIRRGELPLLSVYRPDFHENRPESHEPVIFAIEANEV